MAETAGNYASEINDEFLGLLDSTDQEHYEAYEEAIADHVIDPDTIEAFNALESHNPSDLRRAETSLWTPIQGQGDTVVFQSNGYTVVGRHWGISAFHSARAFGSPEYDHSREDPVEADLENYAVFGLRKMARAVMDAAGYPDVWEFRGQAHVPEGDMFVGSTGKLLSRGEDAFDVLEALLEHHRITMETNGEKKLHQLASFADQIHAELTIGTLKGPISLEYLRERALQYINANVNIN